MDMDVSMFCGEWLLKEVAEKMTAACRHGGGPVAKMEDMAPWDYEWAEGLYKAMAQAAEQYCGCEPGKQRGVCAAICRRCLEGTLEPPVRPCSYESGCTRF